MNNDATDEIREAIHDDIVAIGGPLLTEVKPGTPAYRRQERRYNEIAGRLARARAAHPEAFSAAVMNVHPKIACVILAVTDPQSP